MGNVQLASDSICVQGKFFFTSEGIKVSESNYQKAKNVKQLPIALIIHTLPIGCCATMNIVPIGVAPPACSANGYCSAGLAETTPVGGITTMYNVKPLALGTIAPFGVAPPFI